MACASKRSRHGAVRARAAKTVVVAIGLGAACLAADARTPAGESGSALTSAAQPVHIELRPHVQVRGPQVVLSDIAFLTARDPQLLARLMALPMGAAPRPGAAITLERQTLAEWIATRGLARLGLPADLAPSAIAWVGATQTQIETASRALPGETVEQAARAALLQWLSTRSAHADVQASNVVPDLMLPAGDTVLQVRPLPEAALPARRMQVWIDVLVDAHLVRTLALSFDVQAWGELPVATATLARGAPLDKVARAGLLQRQEVDLAGLRQSPCKTAAACAGEDLRLRRPLREGEVLTMAHLEKTPLVSRGQWAQLEAGAGGVQVSRRVEVLQDGAAGDTVRVKLGSGGGEMLARVRGPGQVEAQP